MVIAELKNVTKRYGPVTALDSVDLQIEGGQLLALLGPNGAGKTTAVRLLLGLTAPGEGSARVFGLDPRDAASRSRTGAMLQVGKVPETLRVREHIDLFSSYYPQPLPQAEVIAAAGLEGLENRLYRDLSGGQQQRVLFALAICGNPKLLVLDEPTTGLDIDTRRTMWTHIRGFVGRGGSVLLTTHYLEEADALADRIVVIDRARIKAAGTPAEIKRNAASKKIRCVTSLSLEFLQGIEGVVTVRASGAVTEVLAQEAEYIVFEMLKADPKLRDLEVSGAGLEDAFLAITSKGVAR